MKKIIKNLDYYKEFEELVHWVDLTNHQGTYDYPEKFPDYKPPVQIVNIHADRHNVKHCDLKCNSIKDFNEFMRTLPFALKYMLKHENEKSAQIIQSMCSEIGSLETELEELKNEKNNL